jgi:YD repeat-containing protein
MSANMKMRNLILIIAGLVLVVGMEGCANKSGKNEAGSGVEYYRNILFSETPYDIERGVHKLADSEKERVNAYKFTRDNSGRLLSVEYLRKDTLLGYSSMGGAARIVYEYKDNKQVKSFYNTKNERIEYSGAYSAEYTLDDNGIRTGLKFFGKNGEPVENRNKIHSYVWSLLPDGMVRELRYNLEGKETVMNQFCPFYELRFSYNEKGYVTRMANYMADTLYNCTAENCGDIGVSYFTFKSNEEGDVEEFSVFNVIGQMSNLYWGWSKRVNKYDENGNVLETVYFDQDNEYVGGKNIPVTQYDYDVHGAVVKVRNMDKDRNIINHPETGVAVTEYRYDEFGRRTETLRFNKDGEALKI